MTARQIFCIPVIEHLWPIGRTSHGNEGIADFAGAGVQPRILDAELAHLSATNIGAVDLLGQAIMLTNHLALLVQTWRRRECLSLGQSPGLRKDPRIADR